MRPIWLLAASIMVLVAHRPADAELTIDEAKCETKATLTAWKFVVSKTACLVSCERGVRAGTVDPADCVPPYPASPTFGCIQGKEGRATGSICSACNPDAPECYPEICPDTTSQLLTQLDPFFTVFLPAFYCDDSGSPDGLNALEARCQDNLAKYLAKEAYARARCYTKCRSLELKGLIPTGSCNAGSLNDPTGFTQACLASAAAKSTAKVARYCDAPYGGDAPECQGGVPPASWVALVDVAVDGYDPAFYCEN